MENANFKRDRIIKKKVDYEDNTLPLDEDDSLMDLSADNDSIQANSEPESYNDLVTDIIKLTSKLQKLQWDTIDDLTKNELSNHGFVLGSVIRKSIDRERFQMAQECSSLESLMSIDRYRQKKVVLGAKSGPTKVC